MNQLIKLNAMHKIIFTQILGNAVIETGIKTEGWTIHEPIQHTSNKIVECIQAFDRQLDNTTKALQDEDTDLIERSIELYKKDLKQLEFNIQNNQVNKSLFTIIEEYITALKDLIEPLMDVLEFRK